MWARYIPIWDKVLNVSIPPNILKLECCFKSQSIIFSNHFPIIFHQIFHIFACFGSEGVRQAAALAVGRVAPKGHSEAVRCLRDLANEEDDEP
jgi:hypothetical protein